MKKKTNLHHFLCGARSSRKILTLLHRYFTKSSKIFLCWYAQAQPTEMFRALKICISQSVCVGRGQGRVLNCFHRLGQSCPKNTTSLNHPGHLHRYLFFYFPSVTIEEKQFRFKRYIPGQYPGLFVVGEK